VNPDGKPGGSSCFVPASARRSVRLSILRAALFRSWGRFQASPALFDAPDLPWLAMLGWYLIVVGRRDIAGTWAKAS